MFQEITTRFITLKSQFLKLMGEKDVPPEQTFDLLDELKRELDIINQQIDETEQRIKLLKYENVQELKTENQDLKKERDDLLKEVYVYNPKYIPNPILKRTSAPCLTDEESAMLLGEVMYR